MAVLHNVKAQYLTVTKDDSNQGGILNAANDYIKIAGKSFSPIRCEATQQALTSTDNQGIYVKPELYDKAIDVKTLCFLRNYHKQYGKLPRMIENNGE